MRITVERTIARVLTASANGSTEPIVAAVNEARAEALESAVLHNADGWQSGMSGWETFDRPHDLSIVVQYWIELYGKPEADSES